MEVAGAGVVAEAGPFDEDGVEGGGGEIVDGGPEVEEAAVVVLHRADGGLLEHDLAEPDAVGIGLFAGGAVGGRDAPGEGSGVAVVPGEHGGGVERACLDGRMVHDGAPDAMPK